MAKKLTFFIITLVFTFYICWLIADGNIVQEDPCTDEWYSLVEKQVPTGDGSGHGPDLGSGEWRSVVEFKLGIRGNTEIPPRVTDQWCEYIDRHHIEPRR